MVPVIGQVTLLIVSVVWLVWVWYRVWPIVSNKRYYPSGDEASRLARKYYAPVAVWNALLVVIVWWQGEAWVGKSVVLIVFALVAAMFAAVIGVVEITAWLEREAARKAAREAALRRSENNH